MGIRVVTAREDVNKEKFIYESIGGAAFVIVPDQYTLVAEEQALHYIGRACLFDVEITGMNRLGRRILMEKGLESVPMIDKYGRYMLLTKIVSEHREELEIFKKASQDQAFIEMVNDFISQLKQQNCQISDLQEMLESGETGELLAKKLNELKLIVEAYEEAITGRYADSEDYIAMYIEAIADSDLVSGKEIWVYGFDSVTPKFRNTIMELALRAKALTFVVNENDFGLDKALVTMLTGDAAERGIEITVERLGGSDVKNCGWAFDKSELSRRLERDLFSRDVAGAISRNEDYEPEGLTLVECANPYFEAESAAIYVYKLIRDEGYRYRDIVVIANDEEGMQPKIKRVFEEYGLPVFVDSRRGISDSQAAGFVVSMLEFIESGYRTNALLAMLKSGLSGYEIGAINEFENYVVNYKIKGTMWTKPFKYGDYEYSEETWAGLESMRADVMNKLRKLEELASGAKTNREFAGSLYGYLRDVWNLEERIGEAMQRQEGLGLIEEASRTGQAYDSIVKILDQIVDILGDEPLDLHEFVALCVAGLESVEVGLIPQATDGITMGTMIRTRPAPIRAALILGANEGVLPMEPSPEGLFSVDEKTFFAERDFPLGSLDDIKVLEESAAMYRMMSKADDKVYLSYSLLDSEGEDKRPSSLIDSVRMIFPRLKVMRDDVSDGFGMSLVNSNRGTLRHLIDHIKMGQPGQFAHELLTWYEENESKQLGPLIEAASSDNQAEPISRELVQRLYAKNGAIKLSPSRLEKECHCPFSYFIQYGLVPKEQREFESDKRSVGDICHECIMAVSQRLLQKDAGGKQLLDTVGDDEIYSMVAKEIAERAPEYRGGIFMSSEREKFRLERITALCEEAVSRLVEQFRVEGFEKAYFEEMMGSGTSAVFAPIEFDFDEGKVRIEGKIDRVDVLKGGNARVVDYKTGSTSFDIEKMRSGYRMQLMVYLEGVTSGEYKPAGMFYFHLQDAISSGSSWGYGKIDCEADKLERERFLLEGVYVDEPEIEKSTPSEISGASKKLSREDFERLENDVRGVMENLSKQIVGGVIKIEPAAEFKKSGGLDRHACGYCDFKAICRFDLKYKGNRYKSF